MMVAPVGVVEHVVSEAGKVTAETIPPPVLQDDICAANTADSIIISSSITAVHTIFAIISCDNLLGYYTMTGWLTQQKLRQASHRCIIIYTFDACSQATYNFF